jgi:hypothetical protein
LLAIWFNFSKLPELLLRRHEAQEFASLAHRTQWSQFSCDLAALAPTIRPLTPPRHSGRACAVFL